ncbi:hypothetical protein ACFYY1_37080 [Streptomyces sp. NPDC001890]|uniref:hypothetical protein n=1 Tax=Streptomyces sp. NPDC001890 TaxID=3364620 RepID=UPI0036B5A0B8
MRNSDFVPPDALRRLQNGAQRHLAALIADGEKHDLPPLAWTLAVSGALTGEADSLTYTPTGQREAIRQWTAHVGATVDTSHTADGREELYAGWLNDEHMTRGCFRATIFVHREDA